MKEATGIDTSTLVSKTNLTNLKSKIDNLDGDEPKSIHADLSTLSNVVDDAILKKTVYDKLAFIQSLQQSSLA